MVDRCLSSVVKTVFVDRGTEPTVAVWSVYSCALRDACSLNASQSFPSAKVRCQPCGAGVGVLPNEVHATGDIRVLGDYRALVASRCKASMMAVSPKRHRRFLRWISPVRSLGLERAKIGFQCACPFTYSSTCGIRNDQRTMREEKEKTEIIRWWKLKNIV